MKLSGVDKGISTYKTYISEFRFRWPEVRSVLRPHHYKAMGKCSYAVYSKSTGGNVLFMSKYFYIRRLSMTRMQLWPNDLSFRTLEVIWGQIRFLPLTFDRIEVESWGWSQCVSLAQTHLLICNMTYVASHVTSRDLDLRPNSDIDLLRPKCAYFDASWRQEHDAAKIMSLAFLVQKLFAKKTFFKKTLFRPLLTSVALPVEVRSILRTCRWKRF